MKEFVTESGNKIVRLSRWLKIKYQLNITKRNRLFDYADKYDNENSICFFEWNGRKYAIGQFSRLQSPIFFEDEDGKQSFLSGYDCENFYNPIMIELSEDCENVRVYCEKNN